MGTLLEAIGIVLCWRPILGLGCQMGLHSLSVESSVTARTALVWYLP